MRTKAEIDKIVDEIIAAVPDNELRDIMETFDSMTNEGMTYNEFVSFLGEDDEFYNSCTFSGVKVQCAVNYSKSYSSVSSVSTDGVRYEQTGLNGGLATAA